MVFGTATSPAWSPARVLRFIDALPSTSRYRARQLGQAILAGELTGERSKPDLVGDPVARELHALSVGMRAALDDDSRHLQRELLDRFHLVTRVVNGLADPPLELEQIATSPWDSRWPVPVDAPEEPQSLRDFIHQFEAARRA